LSRDTDQVILAIPSPRPCDKCEEQDKTKILREAQVTEAKLELRVPELKELTKVSRIRHSYPRAALSTPITDRVPTVPMSKGVYCGVARSWLDLWRRFMISTPSSIDGASPDDLPRGTDAAVEALFCECRHSGLGNARLLSPSINALLFLSTITPLEVFSLSLPPSGPVLAPVPAASLSEAEQQTLSNWGRSSARAKRRVSDLDSNHSFLHPFPKSSSKDVLDRADPAYEAPLRNDLELLQLIEAETLGRQNDWTLTSLSSNEPTPLNANKAYEHAKRRRSKALAATPLELKSLFDERVRAIIVAKQSLPIPLLCFHDPVLEQEPASVSKKASPVLVIQGARSDQVTWSSWPPICKSCAFKTMTEYFQSICNFDDGTIYIQHLSSLDDLPSSTSSPGAAQTVPQPASSSRTSSRKSLSAPTPSSKQKFSKPTPIQSISSSCSLDTLFLHYMQLNPETDSFDSNHFYAYDQSRNKFLKLANEESTLRESNILSGDTLFVVSSSAASTIHKIETKIASGKKRKFKDTEPELGFSSSRLRSSRPSGVSSWTCKACTFSNVDGNLRCEICDTSRD
jgi:hypothetical protein